ncbi:TIGR02301 family protein [Marinicauda salina]|uniref:TIGR02301 family protein n=1 Tax=Marinicauda salina TaxID=2135793 RepID=A0A2U2BU95_9PROT|nr:TIGR02301 family protein [Marinicauda salina]PWE17605.1 TIGR02301 family protein [Marinicauda salina]
MTRRATSLLAALLAAAALAVPSAAQDLKPYDPEDEAEDGTASSLYPVEQLSGIMGELHYIAYACEGAEAQRWRNAMQEMLDLEAPTRGPFRQRLVDSFNQGFRYHQQRRTRCDAEAEVERRRLAIQGRALSETLRREYID